MWLIFRVGNFDLAFSVINTNKLQHSYLISTLNACSSAIFLRLVVLLLDVTVLSIVH